MNNNAEPLKKIQADTPLLDNNIFSLLSLKDLNREFIAKTSRIQELLMKQKKKFDNYDSSKHKLVEKKELVDITIKKYTEKIDSTLFMIWNIIHLLPREQMVIYQAYFQFKLKKLFSGSPYNKRLFAKPLGFPDDHQMILYISDNHYLGKSSYDKFIHQYSMGIPINQTKRNRKNYFKEILSNLIETGSNQKITCLECGPALEVTEMIKERDTLNNASITLLSSEDNAITYIQKLLKTSHRLQKESNEHIEIKKYDISTILYLKNMQSVIKDQDLIYSSSILDFLNDQLAKKAIGSLLAALKPSGRLILSCIKDESKHKAYTELLGGIYVHYRNKEALFKLTSDIANVRKISIFNNKEKDMNLFIEILK